MRQDRDEHISILRQNIQSQFSQEYDVRDTPLVLRVTVTAIDPLLCRYAMSAMTMEYPMTAPQ